MALVYALVDPRDNDIRYVGITRQRVPAKRYWGHINEACKDTHTRKRAWIRGLMNEGLLPIFTIIESREMSKLELCAYEIAYIAEYTLDGYDLLNMTEGGDGLYGYAAPRTDEWRAKLSEATRKHNASLSNQERSERSSRRLASVLASNGGVYPGYTKGRTSPMKGRTLSEESKQKMRDAHKRRWARIHAEGKYDEVCANIAAGTKRAMNAGEVS